MTDPTPDLDLLRRFARTADKASLGELATRYETALLGLARGILGSHAAACDAVQETWVRVIRHAKGFDGRSSFKTWIYRILINRAIDLRVRRKSESLLESVASPEPPPRDDEQHARLRQAMDELPESSRLILLLCGHHGLTHEQAAGVLEIPVGTLKSRQHAAMRQLRAAMGIEESQVHS
jgi:RNA polymerase sigma-70 factor (ECF subfamily)